MKPDKDLIRKFLAGECSEQEAAQLRQLLQDPELLEAYFPDEEWRQLPLSLLPGGLPPGKRWNRIRQQTIGTIGQRANLFHRWMPVAAILILLAGIGFFWIHSNKKNSSSAIVKEVNRAQNISPLPAPVIVRNTLNRPVVTVLPDGSEVSLAPQSVLRYEADYNATARDIVLEGKALFNVRKDKQKPFTVYANGFATTALGTSFTVSSFAGKPTVKVALHTGKVVVKSTRQSRIKMKEIFLEPGEQWKLNRQTLVYEVERPGIAKERSNCLQSSQVSITATTLDFDRAPLSDVFQLLGQYFHVRISYEPISLRQYHFTGTIKLNDSIAKVLARIAAMQELNLQQTDDHFSVSVKR